MAIGYVILQDEVITLGPSRIHHQPLSPELTSAADITKRCHTRQTIARCSPSLIECLERVAETPSLHKRLSGTVRNVRQVQVHAHPQQVRSSEESTRTLPQYRLSDSVRHVRQYGGMYIRSMHGAMRRAWYSEESTESFSVSLRCRSVSDVSDRYGGMHTPSMHGVLRTARRL